MPRKDEITSMFDSIVENALDFIEASVRDLEVSSKFSVVHFAAGLELLLKARLFAEHWTLIASSPHKASWPDMKSGKVATLRASEVCTSISHVTGQALIHQSPAFDRVFQHRNQVLHLIEVGSPSDVVREQFVAWFHLHGLLSSSWVRFFQGHEERVRGVAKALIQNQKYLQASYDEIKGQLHLLEEERRITQCPSCKYPSGEIDDTECPAPAATCWVCKIEFTVINFGCGNWHIPGESQFACECGKTHETASLVERLDGTSGLPPKEASTHGPGRYSCAECFWDWRPSVVQVESDLVCLGCGARFRDDDLMPCEACGELWVGSGDDVISDCSRCIDNLY